MEISERGNCSVQAHISNHQFHLLSAEGQEEWTTHRNRGLVPCLWARIFSTKYSNSFHHRLPIPLVFYAYMTLTVRWFDCCKATYFIPRLLFRMQCSLCRYILGPTRRQTLVYECTGPPYNGVEVELEPECAAIICFHDIEYTHSIECSTFFVRLIFKTRKARGHKLILADPVPG